MPKILIAEDEVSLARSMRDALAIAGHDVRLVHVGEKVLNEFRNFGPDLVVLDVRLGGVSGLNLLADIKRDSPGVDAIVVTAYGNVETAVEAMKRGATDFLTKPIDLDVLAVAIDKVWSAPQARRRLEQFRVAQDERLRQVHVLGESPPIASIRDQISRLAQRISLSAQTAANHQNRDRKGAAGEEIPATGGVKPTDDSASAPATLPPILLTGETGTGKDLLASYIHAALPHRAGPFVALNCTAVPADLFESELFGHQRGSFSGATADKPGLFETADEGTLFLDEIGDLPLSMQPKLLRSLETHTIRRVGDTRDRHFDVCLVAATNRNLADLVSTGRFREDLYYRLKVVTIELPPLRARGKDVLLLADDFCRQLGAKYGIAGLDLSPAARAALSAHPWPGNVRELRHALESAALRIAGTVIDCDDLAGSVTLPALSAPIDRARQSLDADQPIDLEELERNLLQQALERTGGNVSGAARLLSISREAVRYRMAKFNLTGSKDEE